VPVLGDGMYDVPLRESSWAMLARVFGLIAVAGGWQGRRVGEL